MTLAVEQIKSQVGTLTQPERAELAHYLLISLESDEPDTEENWRREITRRVADIRSGQVMGRSADEVLAELRVQHP